LNDLFAGSGADIVMHGHRLDVGDLPEHSFQDRTGSFNQISPHLLQQVLSLI
jgi:hypothetical protein